MTIIRSGHIRSRSLATGILGGLLGRSAGLLAPFLVMPSLLKYLGTAAFGIWLTVVSITSMAAFVDFGIGNGLLTRLSYAYGSNRFQEMRKDIATAYLTLAAISGALLLLVGAVLYVLVDLHGYILADVQPTQAVMGIVVVSIVTFLIGVPVSTIQKVMYSCQLAWVSNLWLIAGAVLSVVLCRMAVSTALPEWQVIGAYSASPILTMLVSTAWFFRRHKALRPCVADFSLSRAKGLLSVGGQFFLLSLVTSFALNADNAIIASRLGAESVTEYAVPAKLASLLGLLVTALFLPLWAANGEALAKGDYSWIRKTTLKMSIAGGLAVLIAGIVMVASSGPILSFWMGRHFANQDLVLAFFSLLFFLMAVSSPFQMLLNSAGKVGAQTRAWMYFALASIPCKYLLVSQGDTWMVPLVGAIAYLLCIVPIVVRTANKIMVLE